MISIVIPAFNEEERIKGTLKKLLEFDSKYKRLKEIIVVNNGSTDATQTILMGYSKKVKLINLPVNLEKGGGIRAGIMAAKGDNVLFVDADNPVAVEKILEVENKLKTSDIVIGRKVKIKPFSPVRFVLGKSFVLIVNILFNLDIWDVLTGFKGFRKDVAVDLFKDLKFRCWIFDLEILIKAKQRGYKIDKVDVEWRYDNLSKLRPLRDSIKIFMAVMKLRSSLHEIK